MSPSPLLRPVGPEPARIYWLRRAVALGSLLVIVLTVAYACTKDSGGTTTRDGERSGPTPTTTSPAPRLVVHRCGAQRLTVEAETDAETYPVGSSPRLTAVVRNTSGEPCRLAAQPSARSWTVSSGPDEVWSTDDCADKEPVVLKRLKAGKQVTYAVTWDGHRSDSECTGPGDEAQPGTYRLDVTVDGAHSDPVIFHLTG